MALCTRSVSPIFDGTGSRQKDLIVKDDKVAMDRLMHFMTFENLLFIRFVFPSWYWLWYDFLHDIWDCPAENLDSPNCPGDQGRLCVSSRGLNELCMVQAGQSYFRAIASGRVKKWLICLNLNIFMYYSEMNWWSWIQLSHWKVRLVIRWLSWKLIIWEQT